MLVCDPENFGCFKENEILHEAKILYRESYIISLHEAITQSAITCSKLTIETLEQGVKYVQS